MAGTAPGPHRDAHSYGRYRTGTLITMAGTAPGLSLLWPVPHRDSHYFGRYRTGTLITLAGTAPGLSLLWPVPPGLSLLWPVPHRDSHYYGRYRTGTLITMAGTDTPFGPYKVISKRCEEGRHAPQCKASVLNLHKSDNIVSQACAQKVFHYAFCMCTLSAPFANVLMMQGIYHKPSTRPIWTGHTCNFLVHGEHARTC